MWCWGWNGYGQVMLVAAFLLEGAQCFCGRYFLADAMLV